MKANSHTPFFTVVIPTLNEAEYVPRLLNDLVEQSEQSFEVIIVDGGSQDATVAKAKEFKSKLNLTIIETKKRNVSWQRNLGAKEAKGDYLIFLDADIQIPKKYLLLIKNHLEKTYSPFVTTRLIPDSRQVYDEAIVRLLNLTMEIGQTLERPFVGGYNFIVAKGVYDLVGGFREDIVHAEDYDLSVRLNKAGYRLTILKNPKAVVSLRRFRREGRLTVLQKNAQATLHVLTKGAITREIFSYPMGGLWYRLKARQEIKPAILKQVEKKIKRFLELFLE